MKAKKNITINDLANALKTSPSTVSRALKDHPKISDEMKIKVRNIAVKMGYVHSVQKAIQQGFNNNTIGLILPSVNQTKYKAIIESARKVLEEEGYRVVVSFSSDSAQHEEDLINLYRTLNVKGVILSLTAENKNPKYLNAFIKAAPVVLIDRINFELPCNKIMIDHYQVGFRAVQHLLNIGSMHIAHIGGDISCPLTKQVSAGYKNALRQSNKNINAKLEVFSDNMLADIMKAAEMIYSTPTKPDAILVDDIMAAQKLVSILQARKIKVPEDVAVVAIGDEQDYSFYSPSITTVQLPYSTLGERAARLLLHELRKEKVQSENQTIVEPFNLNIRNSTLK